MTVRDYLVPRSLAEAVGLLEQHGPELLVMAGGTVAMPLVNEGISLPERVMSLRHAGLDEITVADGMLRVGATATLTRLAAVDAVPLLSEAARRTASWPVRNMATVGGNLFTPPPGGDVAVALLALDAQVRLGGPRGERSLPLAGFFTGFMTTALAADELLIAIEIPTAPRDTAYLKLGRRQGSTPAVVTVAVALARQAGRVESARIALGAAGPHPIRAAAAEAELLGASLERRTIERVAEVAAAECRPFTDAIATEWYRRRMVRVFVRRALEQIAGSGTEPGGPGPGTLDRSPAGDGWRG